MNIEIPPFYVGQEVVANQNHPQKAFKKGEEFTITSVERLCCQWIVRIGILHRSHQSVCNCCGRGIIDVNPEWPFNAHRFSPKLHLSDFISMKQLVEETLEVTGAN